MKKKNIERVLILLKQYKEKKDEKCFEKALHIMQAELLLQEDFNKLYYI